MRRTHIALAMVLTASAANAQDSQPAAIGFAGAGQKTCAEFVREYDPQSETEFRSIAVLLYLSWAQGLMSGLNIRHDAATKPMKDLREWSFVAQVTHLQTFCNKNPSKQFAEAVYDLFNSLPTLAERK
jgi:hypothetical protein